MKREYLIIGGITLVVVAILALVFLLPNNKKSKDNEEKNVNQLICKSEKGNITITYNDTKITSYAQDQIEFNLTEQNEHVKEIGLKKYIEEFSLWFSVNYQGECINY